MENRLLLYWRLVRMDKPVGTLLLLWPTLCALWIASNGKPPVSLVVIFSLGTVLMRSAGCAINDFADRHFDRYVKRTADRPLTSGKLEPSEAIGVAVCLVFFSGVALERTYHRSFIRGTFCRGDLSFFQTFFCIASGLFGSRVRFRYSDGIRCGYESGSSDCMAFVIGQCILGTGI